MDRRSVFAVLLVLAGIAAARCDSDGFTVVSDEVDLDFLEHVNYGCRGRSIQEDPNTSAYLRDMKLVGDTLTLTIHFEANCCPDFEEYVSLEARVLDLDLVDTEHGCRCLCPFENDFRLLGSVSGDLRIRFRHCIDTRDACAPALDTLVTLPG